MPEAFTMPNQIAKTTADKLYQGIVCRYGVTEGSEVNECMVSGDESKNEYVVDMSTENESTEDEERVAPADQRPQRNRNPPLGLTCGLDDEQVEFRDLVEDND